MPLLPESETQVAPKSGLYLLQGLTLLLFLVFGLRLWFLQMHKGEFFAELARENQLSQQLIYAPRGLIRDRNGVLLAENKPSYALVLVREDCEDIEKTLDKVAEWTDLDRESVGKRFDQGKAKVKPFEPMILVSDIPFDQVARIESNAVFWPGLAIEVLPRRYYPEGPLLSHILGYVAEANEKELEKDPELSLHDMVGKAGVELVLERELRGSKGLRQLEVDVTGRDLNNRVLRMPTPGKSLALSIDLELQKYAARLLEGESGGVVVLEPFSGQVLALVTQPSYDNNIFTGGLSHDQWLALKGHPRHPLQNRVIQSVYPPGSVWKLMMAACGLHEGVIKPEDRMTCTGAYQYGKRVFRCWKGGGHGSLDLKNALVHSCDVYFYKLGEKIGVDRISKYAQACGFGKPTGIDLPHENAGLVPTKEWKKKRFDESWQGGDTLNMSIGQGFTLAHPLQVARFLGALVNGGNVLKPMLLADSAPVVLGRLPLVDEYREMILDSMVQTVERGTARRVYRPDARIGAKTGTAQVVRIGEFRKRKEDMPYAFRDHAWMASWGEKSGHTFVVVVMVEHGGHGGSGAGPVVKALYEYLFRDQSPYLIDEGNAPCSNSTAG